MIFGFKSFFYDLIAKESSTVSKYVDHFYFVKNDHSNELLFKKIECQNKSYITSSEIKKSENDDTNIYFLNGTFNYDLNIQKTLSTYYSLMNRHSRMMLILYNPYWSWLFKRLGRMGLINAGVPATFLTRSDLHDLCSLTNFEVTRIRPVGILPFRLLGLGPLFNKVFSTIPGLRQLSLSSIVTLRPIKPTEDKDIFLSIVIPARNEAGNIENALLRMPKFNFQYEIIFIEGNSTDDTWNEIKRVSAKYADSFKIKFDQQTGKGKANAVEKGFEISSGNLLTILDADLTMPPEMLPAFVSAYKEAKADFVNGSRLLYPMEGKAMRFLNKLGNIFFAKSLSFVLETRLSDSLCGTKLFSKKDYDRFLKWREDFGRFDPFGDFDLLFPAAILGLGVINLPIQYYDRTYGETNISRFSHGFMLLKMTLVGLVKVRLRII